MNLFGISNDDFLSFKEEKKLATHSSVTGDRKKNYVKENGEYAHMHPHQYYE